jgi:hypothetical protein
MRGSVQTPNVAPIELDPETTPQGAMEPLLRAQTSQPDDPKYDAGTDRDGFRRGSTHPTDCWGAPPKKIPAFAGMTEGAGAGLPWAAGGVSRSAKPVSGNVMVKLLLVLVFVVALAVPVFNRVGPALFGFPFFYWYQILGVPLGSLIIFIVFRAENRGDGQ